MKEPLKMEKFSLRWNDFESNASKTFRNLRKEEHFFDVTLISDDEHIVSAHKLVLAASSDFFKNILKKSTHSNPMIYLPGVQSMDLDSIISYVYYGEVQLHQDSLDNFLDVAQKLRIQGLTEGQKNENQDLEEKLIGEVEMAYPTNERNDSNIILKNEDIESRGRTKYDDYDKTVSFANQDYSQQELTKAVDDLILREGGMSVCQSCGKTAKSSSQMRKHVEIHIEGLSFPCPNCNDTFRSRNILKCHKQRFHTLNVNFLF